MSLRADDVAQLVEALVTAAGKGAAELVRVEEERWAQGADIMLTEAVEPADCCDENRVTGLVVRAEDRRLHRTPTETIRRIRIDRSVAVLPVTHCPFCGVRYHPVTDS